MTLQEQTENEIIDLLSRTDLHYQTLTLRSIVKLLHTRLLEVEKRLSATERVTIMNTPIGGNRYE